MSIANQASDSPQATSVQPARFAAHVRLGLAAAALVAVLLLPIPMGLPVAGHRMLAILAFAVVAWMTEAIDRAPHRAAGARRTRCRAEQLGAGDAARGRPGPGRCGR